MRPGTLPRAIGVLVVLDALEQRVGAVADADDGDAHLVLRRARRSSSRWSGHGVLSIAHPRDGEPVGERGEDDVVRVGARVARLRMDLVLQLLRHAEEEDGARAC